MIKTINLTAGTEHAVQLTGGVHVRIENRGTGIVYASKSDNVTAGEDGVIAVVGGSTKYIKNACNYANYEGNFGYKGTIYLKSSESGIVEIETGDYFFDSVNKSEGGGGASVDAYTKAEIDNFLAGKVGFADYAQSETAGVVKVSPTYGFYTETGNRTGILKPKTATRENIESGTSSDIRFLTSGNASDLMSVYGIESKKDISTLKSQVAENAVTLGYSGKNLLDLRNYETQTVKGATFVHNGDGTVTVTTGAEGTTEVDAYTSVAGSPASIPYGLRNGDKLIFSIEDAKNVVLSYIFHDGTTYSDTNNISSKNPEKLVIIPSNAKGMLIRISVPKKGSVCNETIKPMIRYASIKNSNFEPYKPSVDERLKALEAAILNS